MSDDLTERLRDRRVCSLAQNSCRNDYICDLAADRIEELEAQLAEAMKLIEYAIELGRWDLNPSLRDDLIDFSAELKGETDE